MRKKLAKFLFKIGTHLVKAHATQDKNLQKLKEIACVEEGHLWTKFDNNDELSNPIKNRMYCRRCGQMYHEHEYIGTQSN